jgi:UDP-N-acetylglucosamine diphosphorylase / glucose-1-phosphate thymidylyltransferase / UDP-N-acetylgalactosamine diphosphorylase / glucosamine-1-phosphate N-acetyltransferase / galactosamine-1-phosphate N-acetyltransferase
VDALVMAAGDGTRLRPLTETWPKPVLPIDGRAVIATLLHELADAGMQRVVVVTGHLAEQVEELLEGCEPRVELIFTRQPQPDGSADAVARGLRAGVRLPAVVSAADTVFQPGDVSRFARTGQSAIAWRRQPKAVSLAVEGGRVVRISGDDPDGVHSAAPLWLLTDEVAAFLDGLPGPPFELQHAFQRAIDAGTTVLGVEIGPTRDLTAPADLVAHNFPYLGVDRE